VLKLVHYCQISGHGFQRQQKTRLEDYIDPQNFLAWQRIMFPKHETSNQNFKVEVQLSGCSGVRVNYDVIPLPRNDGIDWIDAAGYKLAESSSDIAVELLSLKDDFSLTLADGLAEVKKTFVAG